MRVKDKFVDSLNIFGQRLAVKLKEEGVDFAIATDRSGLTANLAAAVDQLQKLAARLRQTVETGLPVAVAHKIWMYASGGAITHLQSADFCNEASMSCLHDL